MQAYLRNHETEGTKKSVKGSTGIFVPKPPSDNILIPHIMV